MDRAEGRSGRRPLLCAAAALIVGSLATSAAGAGALICSGKADAENDFMTYYNGQDFTEVIFTDRKGGARTAVPLQFKGKNDNGKPVWKGDHPFKKSGIRIIAPKNLAAGEKITMRWGDDQEKKGTCKSAPEPAAKPGKSSH